MPETQIQSSWITFISCLCHVYTTPNSKLYKQFINTKSPTQPRREQAFLIMSMNTSQFIANESLAQHTNMPRRYWLAQLLHCGSYMPSCAHCIYIWCTWAIHTLVYATVNTWWPITAYYQQNLKYHLNPHTHIYRSRF